MEARQRMIAEEHDRAVLWAREVLADERTVILDSETTGLHDADFVEVAVIEANGAVLFESRVKASIPIQDGARAVHGISDEDLAASHAPTFEEIWPQLRESLKGRRLVIYNAAFDGPILQESAYRAGSPEKIAMECAMQRYAEFVGDYSEYHDSYTWQRLPGGDHSALGDCRATLEVIREMATAPMLATPLKPTVVCLCGSTRFKKEYEEQNRHLTLEGKVVLTCGLFIGAGDDCAPEEEARIKELHLRKIDLADELFVVNVGGYVGESTLREIDYGTRLGKPVMFLEGEE